MIGCDDCPLSSRVGPSGPPHPTVLILGERPGRDEKIQGRPFIGKSGQILRNALAENGIDPETCYITNTVKCYAEGNKPPTLKEIKRCLPYLDVEIAETQPSVILTLGGTGLKALGLGKTVEAARNNADLQYKGVPVIAGYHPAAGLHKPALKGAFYRDIERLAEFLGVREVARQDKHYELLTETIIDKVYTHWGSELLAVDTEYDEDGLYCYSISWEEGRGYVVIPAEWSTPQYAFSLLDEMVFFARHIVFHQASADVPILRANGVYIPDEWFDEGKIQDSLVLAYDLRLAPLGLKPLVENLLGLRVSRLEEFRGKREKDGNFEVKLKDTDRERLIDYSAQDADITRRLYLHLKGVLEEKTS